MYICIYISGVCLYSGDYNEDFKDWMGSGGHLRDIAIDIDSEMLTKMKKMAEVSKTKEALIDPHPTCMVYSCQGKVAEVLFCNIL